MKKTEDSDATLHKKSPAMAGPERMDDYIRVTSPPVWAALIGILVVVLGVFGWAALGHIKNEVHTEALAENGVLTCYVPLRYSDYLDKDSTVTVAGQTIIRGDAPMRTILETGDEADLLGKYGIDAKDVVALELPASIPDGLYEVTILVESVSPLSLIFG